MSSDPPSPAPRQGWTRGEAWLLLGILAVAAALRFTGLAWGLRHPAHSDERVFVENVAEMIRAGDLDHRYYEYPGLFFYLLSPVLFFLREDPPGQASILAARAVIASFGVLACAILHLWGRRLAGRRASLLAALLLAVSPVAVQTAHMVRPDVVLQVFVLLALLALSRVGTRVRDDVLSGLSLGLAGGVKFSAALLIPTFVVAWWVAPGRRLRGLLLQGTLALAVFLLTTPYALLHAADFVAGAKTQVTYHYQERAAGQVPYLQMVLTYAQIWPRAIGLPACALAVAGLFLLRRDWRTWLPLVLLPLTTVAVLASSQVRAERFQLPSLGVPLLLAGAAADRLLRSRAAFGVGACLVVSLPLAGSLAYLRGITGPLTRDRAVDWARANVPPHARLVSSVPRLGLDGARWEVLEVSRFKPENRPQILEADFVFATGLDAPGALVGLAPLYAAAPETRLRGPAITVFGVPEALRLPYRPLPVTREGLSASENPGDVALACDGRLDTWWRTLNSQASGDYFQVTLPVAARVARIRLDLGESPKFAAKKLLVLVSQDGEHFVEAASLPGRSRPEDQLGPRPTSQVLLLTPPVMSRAVRLLQAGAGVHRWGIAEIGVEALP